MFAGPFGYADIEKTAVPTDEGLKLFWWPKVNPPKGFEFNEEASRHFGAKMFVQSGSTFSNSESVIYAKALFKPRIPETKSLQAMIDNDISECKSNYPDLKVVQEPSLIDGNGKKIKVFSFTSSAKGSWEAVAYSEEGEYFLIFTVSSQSNKGHEASFVVFKSMLQGYRE